MSTDWKALCAELVELDQAEPGDYADWRQQWTDAIKRTRAALAQPEPQGVSEEELQRRFLAWWHNEGSGLPPLPGHDHEEHARRVSEIAWSNGAYVSHYCRPVIEPENQS